MKKNIATAKVQSIERYTDYDCDGSIPMRVTHGNVSFSCCGKVLENKRIYTENLYYGSTHNHIEMIEYCPFCEAEIHIRVVQVKG